MLGSDGRDKIRKQQPKEREREAKHVVSVANYAF